MEHERLPITHTDVTPAPTVSMLPRGTFLLLHVGTGSVDPYQQNYAMETSRPMNAYLDRLYSEIKNVGKRWSDNAR